LELAGAQARRRRPAGASAAPVILDLVRRSRVLIAPLATLVLGCGGSEDRATARSSSTPTATETPAATAEPTPTATPAARPGLRLQRIGTFDDPVYVTAPPGDRRRVFVVEQGGRVIVMRDGRKVDRPFLDVSDRISAGGERGLLSLAFAPDYASSGRFYVYYTAADGDIRIVEYRRSSVERADHDTARVVLSVSHPASNHNGGLVLFGPDGLLYAGLGDGGGGGDQHGSRGNGQNLGTLLGKIIRIDPRRAGGRPYRVPSSNPFTGRSGARAEIYAYGLRNPWRFSFTPGGALVVADVGQGAVEEVSIIRRQGANLGWRVWEGRTRYSPGERAPGHLPPVIQRMHSAGNCSITGGVVVRDPVLSALRGRYVFGDFCRGVIESARLRGGRARSVRETRLQVGLLSSFGEDGRRRVYATSLDGAVYRLAPR
jgi:glucose/arabinose dehydrogenase